MLGLPRDAFRSYRMPSPGTRLHLFAAKDTAGQKVSNLEETCCQLLAASQDIEKAGSRRSRRCNSAEKWEELRPNGDVNYKSFDANEK